MTETEKIYIHGAIGDFVGFQVIDLKTGLSTQDDKDRLIISDFDKSFVIKYGVEEKKISELFKVKRKGNRGYYTYIRYNLSGTRTGCSLGFTFVYENGGKSIKRPRNCCSTNVVNDIKYSDAEPVCFIPSSEKSNCTNGTIAVSINSFCA